jgi:hypothetical protein
MRLVPFGCSAKLKGVTETRFEMGVAFEGKKEVQFWDSGLIQKGGRVID